MNSNIEISRDEVGLVLQAFVNKLIQLTPAINSAFVMEYVHGGRYEGPTWEQEMKDAREMLENLGLEIYKEEN